MLEFARTHDTFTEQALNLATSRQAKEAFDLSQEPAKLRDAYGRNRVGQGMLMARRLIEAGVRFVTIQGYVDTGIYAWDHHWGIFPHLEQQLPIYDNSSDRPISVPDFAAAVYHALGLDRQQEFVAQGRSMKLLPEGSVVKELF